MGSHWLHQILIQIRGRKTGYYLVDSNFINELGLNHN